MNGYVGLRKWTGIILGLFLIVSVFATATGAATWTHSVLDGYDVWYLNGTTQKFRYNLTNQQWSHFSTIGSSWHTISGTGRSATFIGDGAWWDLGNGFSFQYSAGYDKGLFRDGSADRFAYKYATGQWYSTADTLSWKVLGAGGLSADFMGSGSWHDLGNGFTYKYSIGSDKGTFKDESAYRFLYDYAVGQWYHTADTLSWRALGVDGLDAAFIGTGHWYDLGNGFTYQYSRAYDKGTFRAGSTDRFLYKYVPGQWYNHDYNSTWNTLGAGGLSARFLGDGSVRRYDLGNGWGYRYAAGAIDEYYLSGLRRFSYDAATGVWTDYARIGLPQQLGAAGLSGAFVADGSVHDLGTGFNYLFDGAFSYTVKCRCKYMILSLLQTFAVGSGGIHVASGRRNAHRGGGPNLTIGGERKSAQASRDFRARWRV